MPSLKSPSRPIFMLFVISSTTVVSSADFYHDILRMHPFKEWEKRRGLRTHPCCAPVLRVSGWVMSHYPNTKTSLKKSSHMTDELFYYCVPVVYGMHEGLLKLSLMPKHCRCLTDIKQKCSFYIRFIKQ